MYRIGKGSGELLYMDNIEAVEYIEGRCARGKVGIIGIWTAGYWLRKLQRDLLLMGALKNLRFCFVMSPTAVYYLSCCPEGNVSAFVSPHLRSLLGGHFKTEWLCRVFLSSLFKQSTHFYRSLQWH